MPAPTLGRALPYPARPNDTLPYPTRPLRSGHLRCQAFAALPGRVTIPGPRRLPKPAATVRGRKSEVGRSREPSRAGFAAGARRTDADGQGREQGRDRRTRTWRPRLQLTGRASAPGRAKIPGLGAPFQTQRRAFRRCHRCSGGSCCSGAALPGPPSRASLARDVRPFGGSANL